MPQDPRSANRLDPALDEALTVLARVIHQACGACGERGTARLKRAIQGDDAVEVEEADADTLESGAFSAYRDGLLRLAHYGHAEILGDVVGRVPCEGLTVDAWTSSTPSITQARAQAGRRLAR